MNFPIKTLFSSQVAELQSTKEQLKAKQDELVAERDVSRKEKEARAEEVICAPFYIFKFYQLTSYSFTHLFSARACRQSLLVLRKSCQS